MFKGVCAKVRGLIIGAGQIGVSLFNVLKEAHKDTFIRDIEEPEEDCKDVEIVHICYPWFDNFVDVTEDYIEQYEPRYCVIHSTVPPRTTRKIQEEVSGCVVIHSPINGIHPHLEDGIKTFTKYLGTVETENGWPDIYEVWQYFWEARIKPLTVLGAETTELGKIILTTRYGIGILVEKNIYELCNAYNADFKVAYEEFSNDYSRGYCELGHPEYQLPVYKQMSGSLGGHCIAVNAELVSAWVTDLLRERNEWYKHKERLSQNESN